jgi:hypothetical protein
MIARWFASGLVFALPFVIQAQGADAPSVRVWISGPWHFAFGQPVPVSFEVSEAAHVAGNDHRIDRGSTSPGASSPST